MFKNATIFRLNQPLASEGSELAEALQTQRFTPCTGIRPSSFGWISPTDDPDGSLIHEVAGSTLLCAKREDKVVPTSALGELLAEKANRLREAEGKPVAAKERQRLKDDALAELLPRALPKSKSIRGYVTPAEDLLVVDTASPVEAELFLNCLRESLGTLSVEPPQIQGNMVDLFTHWLRSRNLPEHFNLGDQCDLIDMEEGSTVTCRRQSLTSPEIMGHLDAGKVCTKLALVWRGDVKVTVAKDLILRQIKLPSVEDSEGDDDPVASLNAAFAHLTLEMSRFLPALFDALGGENRR